MKCICGFNEKPDNLFRLRAHLRGCEAKRLPESENGYFIVWRDGEFSVVDDKEPEEEVFENVTPDGKKLDSLPKVGLPTKTPEGSLLAPKKNKVDAMGEETPEPKKRKPKARPS